MLPRLGEMGENTPFTRKATSETLERATTDTGITGLEYISDSGQIMQHLLTIQTRISNQLTCIFGG